MANRTLDATGLTVKTLDESRQDIRDRLAASSQWGAKTSTGGSSPMGELIDVHAEGISDLDELCQSVYDAIDPDSAEGVALDNVLAFSPIIRKDETYSTGEITWGGVPTTVVPAGTRAKKAGTDELVASDLEATIGGGGTIDVAATAEDPGPVEFLATSIDEIVDAVAGLTSVTNAADFTTGVDVESDQEARERRERSLSAGGSCTDPSLRAKIEALDSVSHATAISNRTVVTDAFGIPPKSFRVVLWPNSGVDEEAVASMIWINHPGGIYSDGAVVFNITDDRGYLQPVRFSYATELELYLHAEIVKDPAYPSGGDALVETALLNFGNTHIPGQDVLPDRFEGYAQFDSDDRVAGIREITVTAKIGGAPAGGDTGAITISLTEIGRFDSGRITVNST